MVSFACPSAACPRGGSAVFALLYVGELSSKHGRMRFRWGYLEVLGGTLALVGSWTILPSCSVFSFHYGGILECVSSATVYGTEVDTGLAIAVAGVVLFVIGEVGRHSKHAPTPPVT
jgi:hypothetical protein